MRTYIRAYEQSTIILSTILYSHVMHINPPTTEQNYTVLFNGKTVQAVRTYIIHAYVYMNSHNGCHFAPLDKHVHNACACEVQLPI